MKRLFKGLFLFSLLSTCVFAAEGNTFDHLSTCHLSKVGFSDLNFPTEFEVFRHSQENEQGLLVLSDLDISVLGQKKKVSRGKRIISLKITEKTKSKDPKKEPEVSPTLELEILSKDFSEDYRKIEMGGRQTRASESYLVVWGAFEYFCSPFF